MITGKNFIGSNRSNKGTKTYSTFNPLLNINNESIYFEATQEEIDALGGGKTMRDWEARFDLAYQKCKEQNVALVGGVAPTAIQFGKYLSEDGR